ncbi:hypothetical protein B0J12DRAFT_672326 [Macrophomina phaseolina]|uniref:Secreted protein n=1 Tax=Macrophomina phaseolina TaxID=35725 RepID=A0ABQ8G2U3_9PEZI|nr:hypothetical protein B0J12DRAFT_672326 [Macrophomina phaseolina]
MGCSLLPRFIPFLGCVQAGCMSATALNAAINRGRTIALAFFFPPGTVSEHSSRAEMDDRSSLRSSCPSGHAQAVRQRSFKLTLSCARQHHNTVPYGSII